MNQDHRKIYNQYILLRSGGNMGIDRIQEKIYSFRVLMIAFIIFPWMLLYSMLALPFRIPLILVQVLSGIITITFCIGIFMITIWREKVRHFAKRIEFFDHFLQEAGGCVEIAHYSPFCFPISKDEMVVTLMTTDPELPQQFSIEVLKQERKRSWWGKRGTDSDWHRHPSLRVSIPFGAEPRFAIVDGSVIHFHQDNGMYGKGGEEGLSEITSDIESLPFPYILSIQRLGGSRNRNELITDVFDHTPNTKDLLRALRIMNDIRQEILPPGSVDPKPKRSGWAIQRCAATGFCKQCDQFVDAAELIRGAERVPCPYCGGGLSGALYRLNQ